MKITRKERGITLVALITTIIVLLILAVVSIRAVQGDGIIQHAKNAKSEYQMAQESEQTMLQDYLDVLNINDANASVLDGKGTEEEPYLISSIEDLILFGYDVNCGNNYQGKYVKLEKDLDFNSDASYENANRTNYSTYGYEGNLKTVLTSGEGFIPIGTTKNNNHEGNRFAGVFDGNGKIISSLRINKEGKIVTDIGLFSTNLGEIKNLGIKDCDISINCTEKVNNYGSCGVISGSNWGKINNCWTSGNIEGIYNAGTNIYFGGIVGQGSNSLNSEASISNCYNKTNINAVMNSTGVLNVGGISAGCVGLPVNNCYNIGNLYAENTGTAGVNIGGVIGQEDGNIYRCYNIGKIDGIMVSGNPTVGGIVAVNSSRGGIDYCCNAGEVVYSSARRVGTLVGATEGTVSNSYTLTNAELNGIGRNYSSTPEPTKVDTVAEMPTVLEIVGDAFKEDTNNINNGYPILSWQ